MGLLDEVTVLFITLTSFMIILMYSATMVSVMRGSRYSFIIKMILMLIVSNLASAVLSFSDLVIEQQL